MPELHDGAAVENVAPALRSPKIAVAVSSSRSGLYALKWALEKEVPAHGLVYLLHVQSPTRWVPNPMGGMFPVEQVSPQKVEQLKKDLSLETEKLVDQYRSICDRKKIKSETCYSESDSVQKELVYQISRLGITTLVLGTSQTVLLRALRVERVPAYVAKHAPDFCKVLVVNKDKLCYDKKEIQAPALFCNSPSISDASTSFLLSETNIGSGEDDLSLSDDIQDTERSTWSGVMDENGARHRCFSSTPLDQPWNSPDYSIAWLDVAANRTMETSDNIQYPDYSTHSQSTTDVESSKIVKIPATQRLSPAHTNGLLVPDMPFADGSVVEHERHQLKVSREAKKAMQQATKDAKSYEEALAALEWARKDRECIQQKLAEEMERHKKTQMELATQTRMVSAYATKAAFAEQQGEVERRRCEETIIKLEDLTRKLEIEWQLRKEAEEKASLEAVGKLDALAALKREMQRYSEYSYEELQSATNGFNEENKLGEGGYGPVYRGKLRHTSVAIKVLAPEKSHGCDEFQREVEVLSRIHHPHMLMLLGACPEKGCIVYEYMANGSLEDRLNCKDGTPPLPWYTRFRICFEVATALLFLHSQPQPIVHRDLKPANILLDHHFVSKIGDVGLARLVPVDSLTFSVTVYKDTMLVGTLAYIDPDYQRTGVVSHESDIYSLGIVMLQVLTGKPAVGVAHLVEEAEERGKLEEVLDKSAGDWSLEEARKLARISLQCTEFKRKDRPKLETHVLPILESIQNVAESAAANVVNARPSSSGKRPMVPSFFFCPISQKVMEDPHMAADGFTYEHHTIKVWLQANDTSPMTNLKLDHKNLTPNYTLHSAIREWYGNGLI